MAGKTITLAGVRVGNISLFKNEAGKWLLRAFYEVVDNGGRVRGSGWHEMEADADGQASLRTLVEGLAAQVKQKEGI